MARSPILALCAVLVGGAAACVNPADRSTDLSVSLAAQGPLFLGDTAQLVAQVLGEAGQPAPNVGVQYSTSDALIVAVGPTGLIRATGVGTATITASAQGYVDAANAQLTLRVHALLEVDSVVPRAVRWGDRVTIYGAGLDPVTQRANVTIGGIDARVASYVPDDSTRRGRFGQLTVWVPVPAPSQSPVAVFARGGAAPAPQGLAVGRADRYEPNDAAPAVLGAIADSFVNPALAFEPEPRQPSGDRGDGFDWYVWGNPQTRDLTAVVRSTYPPERFTPFFADTGFTNGLSSSGAFVCQGVLDFFFAVERDSFIVALRGVAADNYWVLLPYEAPFTTAAGYELRLLPGYRSTLPRDNFEENDVCGNAPQLPTGTSNLTIDVVGDADWFRLTVPTGGRTLTINLAAADSNADLDIQIHDASIAYYDGAFSFGSTESFTGFLTAGLYYIVIADYPGVPTAYTMSTSLTAPPPSGAPAAERGVPPAAKAAVQARAREAWERQRAVLEANGVRLPSRVRP